MKKLDGKIAIITGGTTGIGLASAKLFAAEGARVTVTGTNPQTLATARRELEGLAEVVSSDAGSAAEIEQLARDAGARHGRVDVLFLNAGITRYGLLTAIDEQAVDESLRVNFKGPWLAMRSFAPLMPRGSSIVVNTSMTHLVGRPYTGVYAATKAALASLARTAAAELAAAGVRVNAVSPGPVDTPIHEKAGLAAGVQGWASQIPLGRVGAPDDIARVALFLASDDSSFMTGEELLVDGGMTRLLRQGG
jgi:NAD(P)-dependent dehydrogenase (short-subunit alcohol dehydrogenase family)